jgi:hypothetical protein
MKWRVENRTKEEIAKGLELKEQYHVLDERTMTSCSTCHR